MLVQMLVLHTTAQVHVREILKSKESKKLSQVPAEDEPRRIVWMGLGKKTACDQDFCGRQVYHPDRKIKRRPVDS